MYTLQKSRYLQENILADLKEKMVFLGGPRQIGKTTFAQSLLPPVHGDAYFNWDFAEHRKQILSGSWSIKQRLIVLDELHKYARWRNLIKGFYDTQKTVHSFLVTGSARLDHYRKGGDSLLGRYHYYRMHPLSVSELGFTSDALQNLMIFGGFPEPFLSQNEQHLRRWHLQRLDRVIKEDLRDLERVREISHVQDLADALPGRVGAPLSIKNIAEDLQVNFRTAQHWIIILENLYYAYRIPPFGAPKIRAVKKEQKLYLWDWSVIEDPGAKFENLVASHLLKFCHFQEDTQGYRMELRFLRDIEKREVDFVVLRNKKPLFAVECKTGERNLSPHISYFEARTNIPKFYQVHTLSNHRIVNSKIEILPFTEFCKKENIP